MNEPVTPTLNVNIELEAEGQVMSFVLDRDKWCWHASDEQEEAEFPLIAFIGGKRYELYFDGTFAEVEK